MAPPRPDRQGAGGVSNPDPRSVFEVEGAHCASTASRQNCLGHHRSCKEACNPEADNRECCTDTLVRKLCDGSQMPATGGKCLRVLQSLCGHCHESQWLWPLCVKRWLSCALCHSGIRKHARPGDLVLAVSSSSADSAKVWPHRYRNTISKLRPTRVLVAGFQVTKCVPFAKYHDAGLWRHRPDSVYRRLRVATDQNRGWHDGHGNHWVLNSRIRRGTNHKFGRQDLQGQAVLSSWYYRAATDLQGAPPLPQHLANVLSGWPGRYCKVVSHKKHRLFLWKWFRKILPATGGTENKR